MTYWCLNLAFLGLSLGVLIAAVASSGRRRSTLIARWVAPISAAAATVLILTAVFDNIIIDSGLVTYAQSALSGFAIGAAPLEDFAYPVAGAMLLPSLWLLVGGRRARGC